MKQQTAARHTTIKTYTPKTKNDNNITEQLTPNRPMKSINKQQIQAIATKTHKKATNITQKEQNNAKQRPTKYNHTPGKHSHHDKKTQTKTSNNNKTYTHQ